MSGKNKGFGAALTSGIDEPQEPPRARAGVGAILSSRTNRLAELASGAVVSRTHELVDPARCRLWVGHNRDYALLDEDRCADLIESMKAQGRQEVPAIVRRLRDNPEFDYEIICGARRHWAVSWLRAHNYPDFRFLVEPRDLTDEEAFRLADLENRARDDISDIERARDYLRALTRYYDGRQKGMADRLNVTESWLSRYLDLARLPAELMVAFARPQELKIKHITQLKPILKTEEARARVFTEAARIAAEGDSQALTVADAIRRLIKAATPKKSGTPKQTGKARVLTNAAEAPLLEVGRKTAKGVALTLFPAGGGSRADVEVALREVLDVVWK